MLLKQAEVIHATKTTYYEIRFSDGSVSADTEPQYVLNYRHEDGPPPYGAAVHVSWTDGKNYDGTFWGTRQRTVYKLCFGDRTSVVSERKDFYVVGDDPLPKVAREQMDREAKKDSFRWTH